MLTNYLDEVVRAQKRGEPRGVYSICSAHPLVLEAAMRSARGAGPLLIESTCNQVNQYGGYTGTRPDEFIRAICEMAAKVGFPRERLLFGGDHLGPLPWQNESSARAMQKAKALVRAYVRAGYSKIHLDASTPCTDDSALSVELIASRTAELAKVAEDESGADIRYVVGSEVPTAGGTHAVDQELMVTRPSSVLRTLEIMREAFNQVGVDAAWEKVVALVVQPGVEFGDQVLHAYQRERAAGLKQCIESHVGVVYEAHSTDYQTPRALRELVEDHFAILKVGPALTFAFREGVLALEEIEEELGFKTPSCISDVLEAAMLASPAYWERHYGGDAAQRRLARRYSLSDRIRYYWTVPEVRSSLKTLIANLESRPIPVGLLSQFMPTVISKALPAKANWTPKDLLMAKVQEVLDGYMAATQPEKLPA